jgi:thiamine pyrophosphokinase
MSLVSGMIQNVVLNFKEFMFNTLYVLASSANFGISLTVPPIHTLDILPNGQVHIVCNTGEQLQTSFTMNGVQYQLINCNLPVGKYIDTVCDLVVSP